jgi:hypothetical protein
MKRWFTIAVLFFACWSVLGGCGATGSGGEVSSNGGADASGSDATHNPTAQEMLRENPDADFFQLGGVVYMNAASIDWVQAEELQAEEKIGTIAKEYKQGAAFEDGMATKLPKGAEIYKPDTHGSLILIVKWNGDESRYLALLEG